MKKKNYLFFVLLVAISIISCKSASGLEEVLKTYSVANKTECETKDGYWYKDKCWANFKETNNNITASEIDAEVDKQLTSVKDFGLELNNNNYKLDLFLPQIDEEENEFTFISVFTNKNGKKQTLVQVAPLKAMEKEKKKFSVQSVLFDADLSVLKDNQEAKISSYIIAKGKAEVIKTGDNEETMLLDFKGSLSSKKDSSTMPYTVKAGMMLTGIGNTTLEVKGNEVYLNGILGTISYKQFKNLIKEHPEVKTIVLEKVPGSINDAVNMHTGKLIKNAGFTTKVLANSQISSGGVDLFCAGRKRVVTKGAKIGVHSWSGGSFSAGELPKDHPAHQYQIAYFNEVLGSPNGEDFYFYTLQSASFNDIHWMSIDEVKTWNLATEINK
ncbi:hypothetical protein [Polaribacter cellanae]|uniref:Alpha/beta hydrolase n=1 Tax=Polaribacter cellanae TaxID=2818493 RepID=A0A975CUA9_9FLAO|nr:hypothetical protein [Polaribacter cellanae]QTE24312.1 hypothetical protein J3359_08645 [Polaribacter cellanae]